MGIENHREDASSNDVQNGTKNATITLSAVRVISKLGQCRKTLNAALMAAVSTLSNLCVYERARVKDPFLSASIFARFTLIYALIKQTERGKCIARRQTTFGASY